MEERFEQETRRLRRSWDKHDQAVLGDYLVRDVEDGRINVQSILTRHWLTERLFGDRLAKLRGQELRFAAVMNWLLGVRKDAGAAGRQEELLVALLDGRAEAGGLVIPPFVAEAFPQLPAEADGLLVHDYITEVLVSPPPRAADEPPLGEPVLATFQVLWRRLLAARPATQARPSVLEPACGSANDYRFLDAFGLADLLDYSGFDLSERNIANARGMFPDARFAVGNALRIDAADGAFDLCFVHDLFEHLSIEAMERAVAEACRVTRGELLLHFFQLHEGPDHEVRPVEEYHWNRLSLPRMRDLLAGCGARVDSAIRIADFLAERFGGAVHHNADAWTLLAVKEDAPT